jgi:uncharacterized protein with FMN-binding domain
MFAQYRVPGTRDQRPANERVRPLLLQRTRDGRTDEEIVARKLNTNLVAFGSAVVVTLYGLGYARTQSAAEHPAAVVSPTGTTAAAAATASPPPDAATAIARAIAIATATATPKPNPTAPPSATAATGYRDGTYTGTGTSRRGDVTVAVTIQGGRISGVQITRSTTYYPTSDIRNLPAEVVDRQSAQVDMVSGATQSSLAFRGAVTAALRQAGQTAG